MSHAGNNEFVVTELKGWSAHALKENVPALVPVPVWVQVALLLLLHPEGATVGIVHIPERVLNVPENV